MKLEEAEKERHELQTAISKIVSLKNEGIEVFIVSSQPLEYEAFYKQWRNSTYVAALATFGYCDMKLAVCDGLYGEKEFKTVSEFVNRSGISLSPLTR